MSGPLEISMSFIVETDRYFFEQREKERANGALGKIGCWGGQLQIKKGTSVKETPLEAVHREVVLEEVKGLEDFPQESFRQLTPSEEPIEVESDRDDEPVQIQAHLFELKLPYGYGNHLEASNSIWLNIDELQQALNANMLTPATEKAVLEYYALDKAGEN